MDKGTPKVSLLEARKFMNKLNRPPPFVWKVRAAKGVNKSLVLKALEAQYVKAPEAYAYTDQFDPNIVPGLLPSERMYLVQSWPDYQDYRAEIVKAKQELQENLQKADDDQKLKELQDHFLTPKP